MKRYVSYRELILRIHLKDATQAQRSKLNTNPNMLCVIVTL